MANKEKLRRVWAFIQAHKNLLDMETWIDFDTNTTQAIKDRDWSKCGTTACLAGWVALLNGWLPETFEPCYVRNPQTKEVRRVDGIAAEILELSADEKISLFYCTSRELEFEVECLLTS